jgi:hypothetical protein
MNDISQLGGEERHVATYDYDDGSTLLVADLGHGTDASVDVVDDTAIVVVGDEQYDVDLPNRGTAQAFIKNGVLTIEVDE